MLFFTYVLAFSAAANVVSAFWDGVYVPLPWIDWSKYTDRYYTTTEATVAPNRVVTAIVPTGLRGAGNQRGLPLIQSAQGAIPDGAAAQGVNLAAQGEGKVQVNTLELGLHPVTQQAVEGAPPAQLYGMSLQNVPEASLAQTFDRLPRIEEASDADLSVPAALAQGASKADSGIVALSQGRAPMGQTFDFPPQQVVAQSQGGAPMGQTFDFPPQQVVAQFLGGAPMGQTFDYPPQQLNAVRPQTLDMVLPAGQSVQGAEESARAVSVAPQMISAPISAPPVVDEAGAATDLGAVNGAKDSSPVHSVIPIVYDGKN